MMRKIIVILSIIAACSASVIAQPTAYLKNLGTGQSFTAIPGNGGKYIFYHVAPGSYTLLLLAPQQYFMDKSKDGSLPMAAQNIHWYASYDSASATMTDLTSTPNAAKQVEITTNGSALGTSFTSSMLASAIKDPATAKYYITMVQRIDLLRESTVEGEITNSTPDRTPMGTK